MYAYNAATDQATDYLYLDGKLLVRYLPSQSPTYPLTDRQGMPEAETDAAGAVTQRFSYRPYGSLQSGASQTEPGYTGHANDPENGLTYMQARPSRPRSVFPAKVVNCCGGGGQERVPARMHHKTDQR